MILPNILLHSTNVVFGFCKLAKYFTDNQMLSILLSLGNSLLDQIYFLLDQLNIVVCITKHYGWTNKTFSWFNQIFYWVLVHSSEQIWSNLQKFDSSSKYFLKLTEYCQQNDFIQSQLQFVSGFTAKSNYLHLF